MSLRNIVVINCITGCLVPYRVERNGEVILLSDNPNDTEDSCVVTTWDEVTYKNKREDSNIDG